MGWVESVIINWCEFLFSDLTVFHTFSLPHFPLLQFPPLLSSLAISTPAFSTPAFSAPPNHPQSPPTCLSKQNVWSRLVEIIGRICQYLHFFLTSTNINKCFSGVTPPNLTKFVHNVAIFIVLLSCLGVPIFQPVSEWQCNNEDFSAKNVNFTTLIRNLKALCPKVLGLALSHS